MQGHLLLKYTYLKFKVDCISRKLVLFHGFEQNNFNMYTTCVTSLWLACAGRWSNISEQSHIWTNDEFRLKTSGQIKPHFDQKKEWTNKRVQILGSNETSLFKKLNDLQTSQHNTSILKKTYYVDNHNSFK